ncbi:MAG: hypothetical protein R6X29_12555 [Acidimicrobiia bacterium]|jgi:hypothetical protein
MHVTLLFVVDSTPFASEAELEEAAELLTRLAAALEANPGVPVAVHVGVGALTGLGSIVPEALSPLSGESVEWVRRGFTTPHFVMLPEPSRDLQLRREVEALEALGIAPGGLMPAGAWEPGLVSSFSRHGIDHLLLPSALLGDGGPAVVEHLGAVITAVPVIEPPPEPRAWLEVEDRRHPDVLAVIAIPPEVDPGAAIATWRALPGCDLTTPTAYLADHSVRRRAFPPAEPWQQHLAASPAVELLYRKMLRVGRRLSDRTPAATVDQVLAAQTAAAYTDEPGAHLVRLEAHAELVAAATVLESRGKGDWARARPVDWDADGSTEIHIELPKLSLVVDPIDGAAITYLDDKSSRWPATVLPTEAGAPSVVLCRFLPDGHPESEPLPVIELEAMAVEERRAEVGLSMEGDSGRGRVRCELTVRDRTLAVRYHLEGLAPGRFGPEIPIALGAGIPRARVDGGPWADIEAPIALAGHRFRVADDTRQVLIGSPTPAGLFVRPVPGHGVVLWAHWISPGSGRYEATVGLGP